MSVVITMEGALEPLVSNDHFQATFTNLSSAMRNGNTFFLTTNMDGENIGVHIPKILHIREVED